jgi:c-di-GMP-binding flagellar brake protein YcgR
MDTSTSSLRIQDLSPYQITSRREILILLRNIKERTRIIKMLVDGGSNSIVTEILKIDEENNILTIDCASKEAAVDAQHILASDNISFETVLDNIRILFFASSIEECQFEGRPAYQIALPVFLIRLQRREFYRVPTPIHNPLRCTVQIRRDTDEATATVTLKNVSGGGIAIVDEKLLLDNTIGRIYKDCRIYLPGNTVIMTALQIRNSHDLTQPDGKKARYLGCRFIDLPKPMLAAVQRYIAKLEREQSIKTKELE